MDDLTNHINLVRGVVINIFLLLGFVSFCSLLNGWVVRKKLEIRAWLIGFLFGIMAIIAMFCPVLSHSGIMLDCRAGVIGTAALVGGYPMALTSWILPSVYRISIGGVGVFAGIAEMVCAAVLGSLCHAWYHHRWKRLTLNEILVSSAVVGVGTDTLLLAWFSVHAQFSFSMLGLSGFVALLFLTPVSMALLSTFILREMHHDELLESVADSERRMLHSQKMAAVGQLSHRIAHSVLNALAVIMGSAEQAKIETSEAAKIVPIMDTIIRAVSNLSSLTGELMAFSAPGEVRFQRMDLHQCLSGIDRLLAKVVGTRVEVVVHRDPAAGIVRVDPNLIEQVIMHLVINAVDAMQGNGRLTISVSSSRLSKEERSRLLAGVPESERHEGPFAVLSVCDTGCGMTDEIAGRIFEPFFTTKGKRDNAGLGLSAVYTIVRKHQGVIDVKTRPGAGTTFLVYLPVFG